jgi:hypothetical protein
VEAVKSFGLDLSSYENVKTQAEAIYTCLDDSSMTCDDLSPKEQVPRFNGGWNRAWHHKKHVPPMFTSTISTQRWASAYAQSNLTRAYS